MKESNSIKDEAIGTMKAVGKTLHFEGESVILEGEKINRGWKQIWTKVKTCLKKGIEERRREVYHQKEMQSTNLLEARPAVQSMVRTKRNTCKDSFNNVNVGTNGGNKIMESDKRAN